MQAGVSEIERVELSWYGRTCIRLRGRDAVVVHDAYQGVVGPTGRGITGDISTYSHADDSPLPKTKGKPTRDGGAILPDEPRGELRPGRARRVRGEGRPDHRRSHLPRRHPRARARAQRRVRHRAGRCPHDPSRRRRPPPDRGEAGRHRRQSTSRASRSAASLTATRAAELIAQLDPKIVVPMPVCEDEAECEEALATVHARDGRHADGAAAQAHDHHLEPARRDDDDPPGVARQGLNRRSGGAARPAGSPGHTSRATRRKFSPRTPRTAASV